MRLTNALLIIPVLTLSACATVHHHPNRGPTHFVQAQPHGPKPPPEIVRIPKPIASPQLRPMPGHETDCGPDPGVHRVFDVRYKAPSKSAADQVIKRLKAQGLTDFFRDQTHPKIIYLGRYVPRHYAADRVAAIKKKVHIKALIVSNMVSNASKTCAKNYGQNAIRNANNSARQGSTAQGFIGANQEFIYEPGVLYEVWTRPGFVTTIELKPGEQLISKAAGDTVRWKIGETVMGSGDQQRTLVLIKPIRSGVQTNLVLTTNQRVYMLETTATDGPYNAVVSWHYPNTSFNNMVAQVQQQKARGQKNIAKNIDLTHLDFNYRIETVSDTGTPAWQPESVFDDGHKTYIKFPSDLGTTRAPPLFVIQGNGRASLVNYRVRNNYYVVDQIFDEAELRIGQSPQIVVRITREDAGND